MVPSFNKGRFIFIFDSGTKKLSSIYDTKYQKPYPVSNYVFLTVFGIALESLDNNALEDLKEKLGDKSKYGLAVSRILESRKESSK